ncbi:hypothetical protein EW146_g1523 [Bondarzewia mesenterica]|uniref:USP domain-containing protein n=1 Tax=Bondarzewia mesenterica TaxID=1095465 RepID=A0A4V3XG21_9AGAM|nr:hypothetical protein EW146_g1523 [Bondarzewia mesenterica]
MVSTRSRTSALTEPLQDSDRPPKRARVDDNAEAPQPNEQIAEVAAESKPQGEELSEEEDVEDVEEINKAAHGSNLYLDTINRLALDFDFEKVLCGKYFQGRGRNSYAYAHSIHDDHHVFINLETTKVYVLPDGYPVSDPSLEDISYVLAPSFRPASVAILSTPAHLSKPSYDLASKPYLPGYIGLNNIKRNDYMNVVIHCLLHVPPLRDYLLLSNFDGKQPELLKRFATLSKKLWNPRLFKSQVSPHEFLQEVGRASGGKFRMEVQGDPVEFLGWLLNRLHKDLGGTKKRNSSTIFSAFQGEVRMETQQVLESRGQLRRFKCQRLPQYIILHYKRFTKNNFVEEKNPTIVNFPLRGVDFRDYIDAPASQPSTVYDLVANVTHESAAGTTRDKLNTVWKVQLRAGSGGGENEKWFQIQDLIVEEIRKEMIFLGETVLQIWERRPHSNSVGKPIFST